jgi:hypothetical protein
VLDLPVDTEFPLVEGADKVAFADLSAAQVGTEVRAVAVQYADLFGVFLGPEGDE